jgi:hypothetical protein
MLTEQHSSAREGVIETEVRQFGSVKEDVAKSGAGQGKNDNKKS